MKTLILGACALTFGVSVFAQGQVYFNNRNPGTSVSKVYGWVDPYFVQQGNGPADTPAGTTDWSGYPPLSGAFYTAQLWFAPGDNQPASSLQPAYPTTTFRTGAAAGWIVPTTLTLPGTTIGGSATVQLRVWENTSASSWDMTSHRGQSLIFNVDNLGGNTITPPFLTGLQSFSIFGPTPEPSTFVLVGLGAALMWILRRR